MKSTQPVSEIAFQLRTLINSTNGMLELALATDNPSEQREYQQIALKSGQQVARLLGQLLDPAKPAVENQEAAEESEPTLPKLSILLAEDNAINQRVVSKMLEKRGHQVTIAANGAVAVNLAARQKFDLILMDIKMPELNGLAAAEQIRAKEQKTGAHIPIIALTAVDEVEQETLRGVMDGCIQKPFETKRFLRTIKDLVVPPTR